MLVNLETLKYKENKDCVALHFHIGRLCTKFESIYGSEYIVTDKEIKSTRSMIWWKKIRTVIIWGAMLH